MRELEYLLFHHAPIDDGNALFMACLLRAGAFVRVRNLSRVHFMEQQMPRSRNLAGRFPLGDSPLCQARQLEHLCSATHVFDDFSCVHEWEYIFI